MGGTREAYFRVLFWGGRPSQLPSQPRAAPIERRHIRSYSERLASQLMLTARARRQLDWRKAGKFARAPPGVGQ